MARASWLQWWFGAVVVAVAALTLFFVSPTTGLAQDAEPPVAADDVQLTIWRVYVDGPADTELLVDGGYDLLEGRGPNYLLVLGEEATAEAIRAKGLRVTRDRDLAPLSEVSVQSSANEEGVVRRQTFYGGYRTVVEHDAHLDQVESDHSSLAKVYDYGDSWLKVQGRANPNDLKVICLTNLQPGDCELDPDSTKPRAVVAAAIHARELQTSEIAWRLIDELTDKYGSDADITHIMDTTEVWIMPVLNPDGREIVEGGGNSPYLQRKNANDDRGNCSIPPTSSNHHGVDLNRNASSYDYGGVGTTTNPCEQTYRGTGAASEPEQADLEALFAQLWPDQKGAPTDVVAADARGTFISIHSYGDLIFFPAGPGGTAPNDTELRTMAFRMAHYNGYAAGTGAEILYGTTGTTDDYTYYDLGVASFTYEISPVNGPCSGFTPAYSCVDSTLWPLNRDALLYSLRVADSPYVSPQGPTTTSVNAPATVAPGAALRLDAVIDDDAFGNNNAGVNRPAARSVTAAEYYLDASPLQGGTPLAMAPTDGAFNETGEAVTASIPTASLSPGNHTVYVRGRNAAGFWGPVSAASFVVTAGQPAPSLVPGVIEAEDYDQATFADSSPGNRGGAYRLDDVDVFQFRNPNGTYVAGDYVVGATRDGESLEYSVDVATAGTFDIALRVASAHNGVGNAAVPDEPGSVIVSVDGTVVDTYDVDATGGWWQWAEPPIAQTALGVGTHVIELDFVDGYFNIDRLVVRREAQPGTFTCSANAGVLTWTNDGQDRYWAYKKGPADSTFVWFGRTLGATTITDANAAIGTRYQVHYEGIPRSDCEIVAEPQPFVCSANAGVLNWTDDGQSLYWAYKKTPGANTFVWFGRTLGATTITDANAANGTEYQVHYQGIPRRGCEVVAEPG